MRFHDVTPPGGSARPLSRALLCALSLSFGPAALAQDETAPAPAKDAAQTPQPEAKSGTVPPPPPAKKAEAEEEEANSDAAPPSTTTPSEAPPATTPAQKAPAASTPAETPPATTTTTPPATTPPASTPAAATPPADDAAEGAPAKGGALEGAAVDEAVPAEGELGAVTDLGGAGDLGGSIEELDLESMLGTVSAVSRRSESVLKAPATVTTIPARRIRLSGFQSVPELLRTVPGVQVVRNAGGNYLVSLRGLGGLQGNNVVVVIDGVPINSRVDGSVDWAALPVHIDDIESIEVVRGPISSIWGANAYTGVINIVTRRAARDVTRSRVNLGVGMDLNGAPSASGVGSLGSTIGPVAWDVSVNAVHDETMSRPTSYTDDNQIAQPPHTAIGALYKADVQLFEGANVGFVGGSSFSKRSGLGHLSFNNEEQESYLSFGRVELLFDDLPFGFDSVALWTRGKALSLDVKETGAPRAGFTYDDLSSVDGEAGFDVRLDLPWELAASFGAVSGLAYVDAPFVHPAENAKLRPSYGAYANADIDILDAVVLTAGVRTDNSAMVEGLELSYRASALYYNELFGVRLAAGSAYREPSYVEVGARFIDPESGLIQLEGTPLLKAPRVDSAELGVIIVPVSSLRIQPTIYIEHVQQLIVEDFGPLARKTFRNTPDTELITGGELESSWSFLEHYSLYGSVSLLWWPVGAAEDDDFVTTLAESSLNSALTGYLGFQGRWFEDRLGLGVGSGLISGRDYNVRAGIPPQLVDVTVPNRFFVDAAVNGRPVEFWPVWLWGKVLSHLPHGEVESPFPNAATLGTSVMVGVEYRPE